MTVDFYGKAFDEYERFHSKPYIGYISPEGNLVDYNTDLGGSHSNLGNIVSWTFLLWIKQSEAFKNLNINDVNIRAKLDLNTGIVRNADIACEKHNNLTNLSLLQKDLICFLKKAENVPNFIDSIEKRIDISKFPEYIKREKRIPIFEAESIYEIESLFGHYNTKELLLFLKDICIQYMGYDAIEQVKPNGELIKIPEYYYLYPLDYCTYFDKPRTISTTNYNINERFYNYLLMDWKIQQLLRYVLNENTNKYETESNQPYTYQSETDRIYEQEIASIKRLVPLKERTKYFR